MISNTARTTEGTEAHRVTQSHSPAPGSLHGLLRGGVGIAVATGVMNLTTYGFVLAAARLLGPVEYGGVARLMFILLVLFISLN